MAISKMCISMLFKGKYFNYLHTFFTSKNKHRSASHCFYMARKLYYCNRDLHAYIFFTDLLQFFSDFQIVINFNKKETFTFFAEFDILRTKQNMNGCTLLFL